MARGQRRGRVIPSVDGMDLGVVVVSPDAPKSGVSERARVVGSGDVMCLGVVVVYANAGQRRVRLGSQVHDASGAQPGEGASIVVVLGVVIIG